MAMAASSLSSLSSSKTLIFSLLSSPKPLSKRKNHLRPKLPPKQEDPFPRDLIHGSQFLNPFPNHNPNPLPKQIEDDEEEVESVVELTQESQIVDPFSNPNPSPDSNKSFILDLSLRFAALLFVQTVIAIWVLGHGNGGVKVEDEVRAFEKKDVDEKGEAMLDFERVVLEIREMAKEARESEAKERVENEFERGRMLLKGASDEKEGLKKDLGKGRLSSRKRLGFVRSNVMRRNVGKGFGGLRKAEEGNNTDENGGIQQIGHQNPIGDSPNLHEPRQSTVNLTKMIEKSTHADSLVLPFNESSYVGELHNSQIAIERSESDRETSVVNHNSVQREIQIKQRFKEGQQPSSMKSSSVNGRSEPQSKKKEALRKSVATKLTASLCDPREKPWWAKLPFVLAILMRRGPDHSSPKGLYSLKMDSTSDDGGSASYTIVFQHQGDAANFCYLLESFFEELDDFSADIVPLTIDELEERVKSGFLKVVVVRKGQLQLYAGQPLADAETALRSLLD